MGHGLRLTAWVSALVLRGGGRPWQKGPRWTAWHDLAEVAEVDSLTRPVRFF